jgi:hypothetical protein
MAMDDAAQDNQAHFELVVFLNHFSDLPDPRQRGKITYPLDEVLVLALLAVLVAPPLLGNAVVLGRHLVTEHPKGGFQQINAAEVRYGYVCCGGLRRFELAQTVVVNLGAASVKHKRHW